jgi:hypothetical protein
VQSLSRGAQWLLIHLEVQSQHDAKLEARMLLYNARARDHFQRTVASFVILADSSKSWRPTSFHDTIWDCSLKLEFMMRKLIDYPDQPQMPHNPFSWLVAAHHQAKQTKRNPNQRKQAKLRLLKGLLLCGLDRDKIEELLRLVSETLQSRFQGRHGKAAPTLGFLREAFLSLSQAGPSALRATSLRSVSMHFVFQSRDLLIEIEKNSI